MSESAEVVSGQLLHAATRKPVTDLRIEVWAAGGRKPLAITTSGDNGRFSVAIAGLDAVELTFRIFEGDRPVYKPGPQVHKHAAGTQHTLVVAPRKANGVEPTPILVVGQLSSASTRAPIGGTAVEAVAANGHVIVRDTTRPEGLFALTLPAKYVGHRVEVRALGADGSMIAKQSVSPDGKSIATVALQATSVGPATPEPSIDALAGSGLALSQGLASFLAKRKLTTLSALRTAGDLAGLPGLPDADGAEVATLQAHADLAAISSDVATNAKLIEQGYRTVRQIAARPVTLFQRDAASILPADEIARVQAAARARTHILDHARAIAAIDPGTITANDATAPTFSQQTCPCDCQSAVSPLAYLADLIDFTCRHIVSSGNALTLADLVSRFRQPFDQLVASCDALDAPIRQVRIEIEVLRALFGQDPLDDSAYRHAAYLSAIGGLGIAYESLRMVRVASAQERADLAALLGIQLSSTRPDELDQLTFDVGDPAQPTETDLEALVGLIDTHKVPIGSPTTVPKLLGWQRATLRAEWAAAPPSATPLVDPEIISERDLANPVTGDAAYDLLTARRAALAAQDTAFRNQVNNQPGNVDGLIQTVLGISAAQLDAIATERSQGADVSAQLTALLLSPAAFNRLLQLQQFIDAGGAPSSSEWDDLFDIALYAWRQQQFPTWLTEEQTAKLFLGPDAFVVPTEAETIQPTRPTIFRSWRTNAIIRREWQATLQARIDQDQSLATTLATIVGDTEQATLPLLRDTLLSAFAQPGQTAEEVARSLEQRVILDMQTAGYEVTTRVSETIDTLQGFIFAVRNGEFVGDPTLQVVGDDPGKPDNLDTFDEQWRWMGEYSTWRSAMLVFMYPENLLDPTLRPPERQTPVFQDVVNQVRGNTLLTPVQACEAAGRYSQYLRDVCNLDVQASCVASTPQFHDDCRHKLPGPDTKDILYLFGLTPTGTFYYSTLDTTSSSGYAQSFWQVAPGFPAVEEIIGVQPYYPPFQTMLQVIVVAFTTKQGGRRSLNFTTFDLLTQRWTQNIVPLTLPGDSNDNQFSAVLELRDARFDTPPRIDVMMKGAPGQTDASGNDVAGKRVIFTRELASDLSDWGLNTSNYENGPAGFQGPGFLIMSAGSNPLKILAAAAAGDDAFHLMVIDDGGNAGVCALSWIGFNDPNFSWDFRVFSLSESAASFRGMMLIFGTWVFFPDSAKSLLADTTYATWFTNHPAPSNLGRVARNACPFNAYTVTYLGVFRDSKFGLYEGGFTLDSSGNPAVTSKGAIAPPANGVPFDLTELANLQERRAALATLFPVVALMPASVFVYFKEAYFFLPLFLAMRLQQSGEYTKAFDWFRSIYDYSQPQDKRLIYYGFVLDQSLGNTLARMPGWLLDPLNPHSIAETRQNCYLRGTLLLLIQCVLAYADGEFARDTTESVERARLLYLLALQLLDALDALEPVSYDCSNVIGWIDIGDAYRGLINDINSQARQIHAASTHREVVAAIASEMAKPDPLPAKLANARNIVQRALAQQPPAPTLAQLMEHRESLRTKTDRYLLSLPAIAAGADEAAKGASGTASAAPPAKKAASIDVIDVSAIAKILGLIDGAGANDGSNIDAGGAGDGGSAQPTPPDFVPALSEIFCVPVDPIPGRLRDHAEVNLFKLRHCRNIGGLQRQLDPYAAPTTVDSDLPMIGGNGTLQLPAADALPPTAYRYAALIDRAKQLTTQSQQLEAAYLSALEKRDAEEYTLMKARQDLRVTRATMQLQDLRVSEAGAGVALAKAQLTKQQDALSYYTGLVNQGESDLEKAAFGIQAAGVAHLHVAAAITEATTFGLGGIGEVGNALIATATVMQQQATYERRQQDWEFQQSQAADETRIGNVQNLIAEDQLRIAGQERAVAQVQNDNAEQSANFLATKFTNVELYDWMSNTLGRTYRYFLQQAGAMAMTAADQLSFERQEPIPPIIQGDYWEPPSDSSASASAPPPDRRGLTGAERLLADIAQLDQYAFTTNQRKLQLSKTLSLAQLAPAEFQMFRETGVMRFATPLDLFDREFPGHYLRLIRTVKTSVLALIPPQVGIRATLSSSGVSRAVVVPDFRRKTVRREPQVVGLTSPADATGLFTLDVQPELLLPFEGLGVDTDWELRMPKPANPFDFTTIADVLITIDYTALDSSDFRRQLLSSSAFGRPVQYERPFSFINDLSDAWYDLHNPDQTATAMQVTWQTSVDDFPPSVSNLTITQVALYFARVDGATFEVTIRDFKFTPTGGAAVGGAAKTIQGIASTRRGNAAAWTPMIGSAPFGTWTLTLPDTAQDGGATRAFFAQEQITEMLLVISYSADLAAWPQ